MSVGSNSESGSAGCSGASTPLSRPSPPPLAPSPSPSKKKKTEIVDARCFEPGEPIPLHLAAAAGHGRCVAALLAAGATSDALTTATGAGRAVAGGAVADASADASSSSSSSEASPSLSPSSSSSSPSSSSSNPRISPAAALASYADGYSSVPSPLVALLPCSSALHLAAAAGSVSCAQAILRHSVSSLGGGPPGGAGRRRTWEGTPGLDPRAAADAAGRQPYHVAWSAGHAALSSALAPLASVDAALVRSVSSLPGERGTHSLATLASYAVRDGMLSALVDLAEEEEEEEKEGGGEGEGEEEETSSSTFFPDCGVCFERGKAKLSVPGCGHALCVSCAVGLTASDARPPRCPFCRVEVFWWEKGEEKRG